MKKKSVFKTILDSIRRFWRFLWYDESMLSWVLNICIAFLFIKFLLFPGLSLAFASELPIVAVVSGSMEHKEVHPCYEFAMGGICIRSDKTSYEICGRSSITKEKMGLVTYWNNCGAWYAQKNITRDQFAEFPFKNGFNIGDVMFIYGQSFEDVSIGDVIVFRSFDGIPIIHRVVDESGEGLERTLQTKGDHNAGSITIGPRSELAITSEQYIGTAVARLPFVGYVKLLFVKAIWWLGGLF